MPHWTTAALRDHLLTGNVATTELVDELLHQRLAEDHLFDWKVGAWLTCGDAQKKAGKPTDPADRIRGWVPGFANGDGGVLKRPMEPDGQLTGKAEELEGVTVCVGSGRVNLDLGRCPNEELLGKAGRAGRRVRRHRRSCGLEGRAGPGGVRRRGEDARATGGGRGCAGETPEGAGLMRGWPGCVQPHRRPGSPTGGRFGCTTRRSSEACMRSPGGHNTAAAPQAPGAAVGREPCWSRRPRRPASCMPVAGARHWVVLSNVENPDSDVSTTRNDGSNLANARRCILTVHERGPRARSLGLLPRVPHGNECAPATGVSRSL